MMRKNCLQRVTFLIPIFFFGFSLMVIPIKSQAQNCTLNGGDLFPSPNWVSQFGDDRGGGSREHTGMDLGYQNGQTVPQPRIGSAACELNLNSEGGFVFNNRNEAVDNSSGATVGSDRGGYGYQVFYNCGNPSGDRVTLRYSHVPRNPITNGGQILQGSSGNARGGRSGPHYHFEIVIGDRPVDPECVMYGKKPQFSRNLDGDNASNACATCPTSGTGPANLCDRSVVDALIQHGQLCTDNKTRNVPQGGSIDPSRLDNPNGRPDPEDADQPQNDTDQGDGDGGHDHSEPLDGATSGGGFTGDVNDIYPPGDSDDDPQDPPRPPDIPGEPPVPPTPGTPGGDPDLVITIPTLTDAPFRNGCAIDTWTAMVNQAVIQARREDIVNKRFIVKPDSVLDYGCFDTNLKNAQDKLGPIFSETANWAARPVNIIPKVVIVKRYHPAGLKNALASVVERAAQSYYNQQFNNPPLAGATPVAGAAAAKNCELMRKVWSAAKCKNFDDVNVFYKFEDLRNFEPREFPANMRCDG